MNPSRVRLVSASGRFAGLVVGPLCALFGLIACGPSAEEQPPLAYHRDIAPIVQRYCGSCHVDGGIAPFTLKSYDDLVRFAPMVRGAVAAGTMPPWLPSEDSRPVQGSRAMRPQDKADLLRWIDEGLVQGDAAATPRSDLPPAEVVAPPRPDLILDPGRDYLPANTRDDDYHCFIFDPKLTADRFLLAGDVSPGRKQIVHHVIAYEIPESDAATIKAKDPTGQGYTCFGAPGMSNPPVTLVGWAPGSIPTRMPPGTALRVHKGSLIVMQVHYNVFAGAGLSDRTTMQLELTDVPPQRELHNLPLARPKKLMIPAGAADAVNTVEVPLSALVGFFGLPANRLRVYSHLPHMHLLGKRITTSLNGEVILDLPRWDFHWQQGYMFQTPYEASGTDTFKLECHYDNTAANQPVVGGVQQAPRDVTWGEGTLDEMCLNYLLLEAE